MITESDINAGAQGSGSHDLPSPDALAHSEKLKEILRARISGTGAIAFSEYLQSVLYEPGLGYYMAGTAKFGSSGDFVTAPEISPLFGRCLATQLKQILDETGGDILELGAGSGKLALSIFQTLHSHSDCRYLILEPSATLADRQRTLLQEELDEQAFRRVHWLDSLPSAHCGLILANEVLDAVPFERFRAGSELAQLHVTEQLQGEYCMASNDLERAVTAVESDLGMQFTDGYCSEIRLLLPAWVHSMADTLSHGVLLLADYGYPRSEFYLPERRDGTLACYFRHRSVNDPFHLPGLQDITAHVDFTAVAEAAEAAGMHLLGYCSQAAFLMDNDLLSLVQEMKSQLANEAEQISLSQAVQTLTLPGEMGERFQFMALGKNYDHALRGFGTQDLSYRL